MNKCKRAGKNGRVTQLVVAAIWFVALVVACGSPAPPELPAEPAADPAPVYNVRGTVIDQVSGQPLAGVAVAATGDTPGETQTNADGAWEFTGLNGEHAITPSLAGHSFSPTAVRVLGAPNPANMVFTAIPHPVVHTEYTVSGTVLDEHGAGLPGVELVLSGDSAGAATSDSGGQWEFAELTGEHTITPKLAGYSFYPAAITVSEAADGATFEFEAVLDTYRVSGVVLDEHGAGLPGVDLVLSGASAGAVTSDSNGQWEFANLIGNTTITPQLAGRSFNPGNIDVTEADDGKSFSLTVRCGPTNPRGTTDEPYTVFDVNELQNIAGDLGAHYILCADIDASETASWNGGDGFEPIGDNSDPFTGSLDGNGFTITDLTIDRSSDDYVGLFGVAEGASFTNLALDGFNITGDQYIGALVGKAEGSVIKGVTATVNVNGISYIGGLVGQQKNGSITNVHMEMEIMAQNLAGGLVGQVTGNTSSQGTLPVFSDIQASGKVMGKSYVGGIAGQIYRGHLEHSINKAQVVGWQHVGGLVGYGGPVIINESENFGEVASSGRQGWGSDHIGGIAGYINSSSQITHSKNHGPVTHSGYLVNHIGGIVGYMNSSEIADVANFGPVTGWGYLGGVAGESASSTVTDSINTANVTSSGEPDMYAYYVGGLVGNNAAGSKIVRSHTTEDVVVFSEHLGNHLGGLVGYSYGTITDSYNAATVDAGSFTDVGGLLGYMAGQAQLSNVYNTGAVIGKESVGGLIGSLESPSISLEGVYSTANVTGSSNHIGGLIGRISAGPTAVSINLSYAVGDVTGSSTARTNVGGLVGNLVSSSNSSSFTIEKSFSMGRVEGDVNVGGLVGNQWANTTIRNSYSHSEVSSTQSQSRGGLVGTTQGNIENSYSAAEGKPLVGENYGATIINSHWNSDSLTSEQMKLAASFPSWDFTNVWTTHSNEEYPDLQENPRP